MAKPKNFSKINDEKFRIYDAEFRIELDFGNENNVWVFEQQPNIVLGNYCLHFRINWNEFKIDMRKCILGEGDMGEDIFKGAPIEKINYQTKDTFLNLISAYIDKAHSVGEFSKKKLT